MVDWQSEGGLDSIRNSCDVFGKPTNILCRKDLFCTKVIFGLAITDPFRVLENHLFLGYLVVIEDDYQKKSWTKSRAQMKLLTDSPLLLVQYCQPKNSRLLMRRGTGTKRQAGGCLLFVDSPAWKKIHYRPTGWVLVAKVTSLSHIKSSQTDLDHISSS